MGKPWYVQQAEETERRLRDALASLAGRTIRSATIEDVEDDETGRYYNKLVIALEDGGEVVLATDDTEGYSSYIELSSDA